MPPLVATLERRLGMVLFGGDTGLGGGNSPAVGVGTAGRIAGLLS